MKDRLKWMCVGFGFTFGLQVIVSLIFTGVAYGAAASEAGLGQGTVSLLVFGATLGAFLVGGFVTGWRSEEMRIADAVLVAIATLLLSVLIFSLLPENNKGRFVTGIWLSEINEAGRMQLAFTGRSLLFILLAILSSGIGGYAGWRIGVPQEGVFDRIALLIGLLGAVVGPFVLLALGGRDPNNPGQPDLPWYFLVIVLLVVLGIVGIGFFMFTRGYRDAEDISINPDQQREDSPQN